MAFWKAQTKDGQQVSENDCNWSDVKDNISQLGLVTNGGKIIKLPQNMDKYIQAKTASADLGTKFVQVESRYIGFSLGNNIVRIRVDEKTDNISVEVD